MLKQVFSSLRLAALIGATALGCAGNASAAYVVINADPAFGPAFPNLGWRAEGAIYVPDACKDGPPSVANTSFTALTLSGACTGIQMQDVKVFFYDTNDINKTTLETLTFGTYLPDTSPLDSINDLSQHLLSITFDSASKVSGYQTSLSLRQHANDPNNTLAGNGANYFSLEFSSSGSRLVAYRLAVEEDYCGPVPTTGYQFVAESRNSLAQMSISDYIADDVYLHRNDVPEPGTLALVGLAMAGVGVARRRRRG